MHSVGQFGLVHKMGKALWNQNDVPVGPCMQASVRGVVEELAHWLQRGARAISWLWETWPWTHRGCWYHTKIAVSVPGVIQSWENVSVSARSSKERPSLALRLASHIAARASGIRRGGDFRCGVSTESAPTGICSGYQYLVGTAENLDNVESIRDDCRYG